VSREVPGADLAEYFEEIKRLKAERRRLVTIKTTLTPERVRELERRANATELPDDRYSSGLKADLRECLGEIAAAKDHRRALEEKFEDHTAAVKRFLSDMYSTMIDPLAEGTINVREVCDELLKAAVDQRQREHDQLERIAELEALALRQHVLWLGERGEVRTLQEEKATRAVVTNEKLFKYEARTAELEREVAALKVQRDLNHEQWKTLNADWLRFRAMLDPEYKHADLVVAVQDHQRCVSYLAEARLYVKNDPKAEEFLGRLNRLLNAKGEERDEGPRVDGEAPKL